MATKNSIQVAIKVRPLQSREKDARSYWKVVDNSIQLNDGPSEPYFFDYIFDQDAHNQIIFDKMAKNIVHSAIHGFNGTIFAYGQTSSGKTYTMMGDDKNPGVQVLAAKEIFKEIEKTIDRQFLLRVGYIEIYNEKIYDLLNKKNSDLKIHETASGIVNVSNCEEQIITSQEDLLQYLCLGNKERTVGETNMNERSSRSHAIFRIIIESQKMDKAERAKDDAITQSILNLVDLAGSERADQTGARGARLKEGGHINKSLLFLSNVIKQLSENENVKFVSYRDSKLTRILQASLGGNALTAIICTIKPTAVEETQSTLSFAMRAKTIKNKPQLNEIVPDATMMKRLQQKIKDLESHLAEQVSKNESQIKVGQLEQRLKNELLKIISFNSLQNIRTQREKLRRRTWCPATSANAAAESESTLQTLQQHQQTSMGPLIPSRLPSLPKHAKCFTPQISFRTTSTEMPPPFKTIQQIQSAPLHAHEEEPEEHFEPGEMCKFGLMPSSHLSPKSRLRQDDFMTPKRDGLGSKLSITPRVATYGESLETVTCELMELQEFTNLEKNVHVDHDALGAMKQKLETLAQRNAILEGSRIELMNTKIELGSTKESLNNVEKRCDELQITISKLTISNQSANSKITEYERQLTEMKQAIEKLEVENREAVSLDFEFQRHKTKSKLRENDLVDALAEKEKEIAKLEKSLNSVTQKKLQISKEDLMQLSRGSNELLTQADGNIGVKCEDLQNLLDENKKVQLELEKLTLSHKELQLAHTLLRAESAAAQDKLEEAKRKDDADDTTVTKLQLEVSATNEKLHTKQQENEKLTKLHTEQQSNYKQATVEVDSLKASLVEFSGKEDADKTTITNLGLEISTLNEKMSMIQQENEKLTNLHTEQQSNYKQATDEVDSLKASLKEFSDKEDADKAIITNLRLEVSATNEKLSTIQQENENLTKPHTEQQSNYKQATDEVDSLKASLKEFSDKEDADKAIITNLRLEVSATNEKLSTIQQENENLTKLHTEQELNYKQATDEVDSLKASLKEFSDKEDADKAIITNLRLEVSAINEKLSTIEQENENLTKLHTEQQSNYKQATDEVDSLKDSVAKFSSKEAADNTTITNLRLEVAALNEKLAMNRQEKKKVQCEMKKLTEDYMELQQHYKQTKESESALKLGIAAIKMKVVTIGKENMEVEGGVEKLKKMHDELLLTHEQVLEASASIKASLEELTIKSLKDDALIANLRLEIQELTEQLATIPKNKKANIDLKKLTKEHLDLQTTHTHTKNATASLQIYLTQLTSKQKADGTTISNLREELESLKQERKNEQIDFEKLKLAHEALQLKHTQSMDETAALQDSSTGMKSKQDADETSTTNLCLEIAAVKLHNEKLVGELAGLQRQFEDLTREYDDMSNQLMDILQEEETQRDRCKKLESKLSILSEKNGEHQTAETELQFEVERQNLRAEIRDLKSELGELRTTRSMGFESVISQKEESRIGESMRSSGVCLDEDMMNSELVEAADVAKETSADLNERNLDLQRQIKDLMATNECLREENKSILESTERNINEMREEISKLSAELFEKSLFIENCACEDYQTQIESLKKERWEVTIMCEEMQDIFTQESRGGGDNAAGNDTLCDDADFKENEDDKKAVKMKLCDDVDSLEKYDKDKKPEDNECLKAVIMELKSQLELQFVTFETQCSEFAQRCLAAEASITAMQKEHQQQLSDAQTAYETIKSQLETETKSHMQEKSRLQLELYANMESSESDFRQTMQRSNVEWKESKEQYEETISSLRHQLELRGEKCSDCKTLQTELDKNDKTSQKLREDVIENQNHLKKDIAEMQVKYNETEEQLKILEEQYKEAENRMQLEKINNELIDVKQLREEYDALIISKQNQDIKQKFMQEEILALREVQLKFDDIVNKVKDLEEMNCKLQNDKETLQNEQDECGESLQKVISKLQAAELHTCEANSKLEDLKVAIKKLKTENETLLEEQGKLLQAKQKQETQLNDKLKDLKAAIEKLKTENETLLEEQGRLQAKQEQEDQLNSELKDLKAAIEKLKSENETLLEEQGRLLQAKQDQEDQLKSLQDEHCKLKEGLEQNCDDVNHKLKNLQLINSELQVERDELRNGHKNLSVENEKLLIEVKKSSTEKEVLQEERDKLVKSKEEQDTNQKTLQTQLDELAETSKLLENEKSELENQFETKNKESHEKLQELLQTVKTLTAEKRQIEQTIVALKSEHENALKSLKQEKGNLSLVLDQQKIESAEMANREATLVLKIQTLAQNLQETEEKASAMDHLRSEYVQLERRLAAAIDDRQDLTQQIHSLETAHANSLRSTEAIWQAQIHELRATANNDNHELKQRIQSLEAELVESHLNAENIWQARVNELEAKVAAVDKERNAIVLEKKHLQNKVFDDHYQLLKQKQENQSLLEEIEYKCNALEKSNAQLLEENSSLAEQLQNASRQVVACETLREELERLRGEHSELQTRLKQSVTEADQCRRDLEENIAQHKEILEQHIKTSENDRELLTAKVSSSKEEKEKLENTISCLLSEKKLLQERLQLVQEIAMKREALREGAKLDCAVNTSAESNISLSSPRTDRFESQQLKSMYALADDRLSPMQQKATLERKNRRLSAHDERRSQSFCMSRDVASMTDPSDKSCNCAELDKKLQESERTLFIRESQVAALTLELKHHPLKAQYAGLLKRLQDEQEMYRIDLKQHKQVISDQRKKLTSALDALAKQKEVQPLEAPPKILENAETQTHCELNESLHKLQSKYNDLKNICRNRGQIIRDLEAEAAKENLLTGNQGMSSLETGRLNALQSQCEALKKELKILKEKYENAKIVIIGRHEELKRLRALLGINVKEAE